MLIKNKSLKTGNTTLEYAIILPVVFACVFVVIVVFLVLYQKAFIQNFAEDAAQSLSRQWGYMPLPAEEMKTGVYQKETYDTREIYWQIKLWNNNKKENEAEKYIKKEVMVLGLLNLYQPQGIVTGGGNILGNNQEPVVLVNYTVGLPSTLTVNIKAAYIVPGGRVLKLIGIGDYVMIEGQAQASVYDAKDMINTTDYVIQLLRETKAHQSFTEKISLLKENLKKLLKK